MLSFSSSSTVTNANDNQDDGSRGDTSSKVDVNNTCGVDVVEGMLSQDEFVRRYLSRGRPVLMRRAASSWPAMRKWTRAGIIKRLSNHAVGVGPVPYAHTYGLRGGRATVEQCSRIFLGPLDQRPPPERTQYIFDAYALDANGGKLAAEVGLEAAFPFYKVLHQFIYGPAGSGAPPHFHGPAVNALIRGRKRWYLWPPSQAYFTVAHVQTWLAYNNNNSRVDGGGDGCGSSGSGSKDNNYCATADPVHVCEQGAGDIFFVPDSWGHAVVNRRDAVAVALEFHE